MSAAIYRYISWFLYFYSFEYIKSLSTVFTIRRSGGYLECHDDRLDSRCVAYILYLVDDWSEDDGGELQLLEMEAMDVLIFMMSDSSFFKLRLLD